MQSSLEELIPAPKLVFQVECFEHVVFHDPLFAFAVKLTRPGTFGLYGDILEYLDRLDYCNGLFGDEITVDGVLLEEGERFRIVTSQPWIPEDHDATPPTLDEIEAYFEALKFQMFWLGPESPAFYREDLDLVARDAHEGNFIRSERQLVPIDVIVSKPNEDHRKALAEQLGLP